jgi:hypothetical protein
MMLKEGKEKEKTKENEMWSESSVRGDGSRMKRREEERRGEEMESEW